MHMAVFDSHMRPDIVSVMPYHVVHVIPIFLQTVGLCAHDAYSMLGVIALHALEL